MDNLLIMPLVVRSGHGGPRAREDEAEAESDVRHHGVGVAGGPPDPLDTGGTPSTLVLSSLSLSQQPRALVLSSLSLSQQQQQANLWPRDLRSTRDSGFHDMNHGERWLLSSGLRSESVRVGPRTRKAHFS